MDRETFAGPRPGLSERFDRPRSAGCRPYWQVETLAGNAQLHTGETIFG